MTIKPNPLEPYKVLYDLPKDTWLVINIGGRGGGKSHEVSKYGAIQPVVYKRRVAVLRDQQSTIEQSILNEIRLRYTEIDQKSGGYYNKFFDFQVRGMKDRATGKDLVFTKGFQSQNSQQKAALKSLSDVDIAIIEEAEDIRDEQKFNTFADSIRKEDSVIIINLNTPDKNHWIVKRYFHLKEAKVKGFTDKETEGFFELIPKDIKGVVYIFTTYKDNPHLPQKIINRYEEYGNKQSELYDPEYYFNSILGLASSGKKGRIYKNWTPIKLSEFNALPYPSFAGLDFGYSNDPNALLEIKSHNNKRWIRKACYDTGMSDDDLADVITRELKKGCPVYCDPSQPKAKDYLRDKRRLNIDKAVGGPDSIDAGIKHIKSLEVYYVDDKDIENELMNYTWKLDSSGEPTDVPIDDFNHLMDAFRYGEMTNNHMKGFNITIKRNGR